MGSTKHHFREILERQEAHSGHLFPEPREFLVLLGALARRVTQLVHQLRALPEVPVVLEDRKSLYYLVGLYLAAHLSQEYL